MTEGLVTRIGRWIDNKFEAKATERELYERWNNLEYAQSRGRCEIEKRFNDIAATHYKFIQELQDAVKTIQDAQQPYFDPTKDLEGLKTRIERLELYSGMTRKVDPTKAPVVKSAFEM